VRRLLLAPLLVLGFVAAVAISGNAAPTARMVAGAGTIKTLNTATIVVHGSFDIACFVTTRSPSVALFAVGQRVELACKDGVLTKIHRISTTVPTLTVPSGTTSLHADTGTTSTTTPITTTTTTSAGGTNAYGFGSISALTATSISVTGDRTLTCSVSSTSPSLGGFHVGDAVKMGCHNGVLVGIVASTPTTSSTTTTTTATTNAYGFGTITALTSSSISVTGDRSLTCSIGSGSPALGDYHVGDAVKMGCQNSVLYGIVHTTPTTTSTTTTTTTTTTPSTSTTTTPTTTTSLASGSGTITALSASSVTVTGDSSLTCSIGSSGPNPATYGLGVGSRVSIGCTNGVLSHVTVPGTN